MPRPVPVHSMAANSIRATGSPSANGSARASRRRNIGRSGLWTPASVTHARGRQQGPLSASPARPRQAGLDRGQRGRGERFVNEAVSYHDFVEAMFDANARSPSIPCYLICDAAFIEKYGLGVVYPGTGNLSACSSRDTSSAAIRWTASLRQIGIDAAGLARDGRAPQRLCANRRRYRFRQGRDRAESLQRRRTHKPNPCIGPIAQAAPYLRCRNLARRHRGQYRSVHGCRRARAGQGSSGHSRPLCLRQRHGVDRCRVHIQDRAPRSVPEWSLPIARRCMPRARTRCNKGQLWTEAGR